ncbi:MAG TPA: Zn-dependent protease [Spirochaeta sp.]|nr:Zn-dependent protease [Spirochaeta sp.]
MIKHTDLVHTYSIIAIDREAGLMGGAVQSHYFSVGGTVIWAEAGTGVIATQAMINMDYGPQGLELLRGDLSAGDVLSQLTAADKAADIRQAAVLDCEGRTETHTGAKTIAEAGHITGRGYSVQANMMLKDTVPAAMAEAFETAAGRLQDRLMAALKAAEAEGGDIRGMQSAAMLIVSIEDKGSVRDNRILDLRVEDNPAPLDELERLLRVNDAYYYADQGDLAVEKGDADAAMEAYRRAEELQPDNIELLFWKAVSLLNSGQIDTARVIFAEVFKADENWRELLKRLPSAGVVTVEEDILQFI